MTAREFKPDYYGRLVQCRIGSRCVTVPYNDLRAGLFAVQHDLYDALDLGAIVLDESDLTEAIRAADERRAKWLDHIQENVNGEF